MCLLNADPSNACRGNHWLAHPLLQSCFLPHCSTRPQVHRSVVGMAGRLPPAAADALAGPLTDLQAVALEAVAPTFRALVETAEELLLQMHAAPAYSPAAGSSGGEEGVTDTSAFMRDLARHLAHCRLEYLTKFNPSPASPIPSGQCYERCAQRLSASVCSGTLHLPSLLLTSLPPSPPVLPLQWPAPWWSAWRPAWCCLRCGTPPCCARCRSPASCSWQRWAVMAAASHGVKLWHLLLGHGWGRRRHASLVAAR